MGTLRPRARGRRTWVAFHTRVRDGPTLAVVMTRRPAGDGTLLVRRARHVPIIRWHVLPDAGAIDPVAISPRWTWPGEDIGLDDAAVATPAHDRTGPVRPAFAAGGGRGSPVWRSGDGSAAAWPCAAGL